MGPAPWLPRRVICYHFFALPTEGTGTQPPPLMQKVIVQTEIMQKGAMQQQVMSHRRHSVGAASRRPMRWLLLYSFLLCGQVVAQPIETNRELQQLANERAALAAELDQFQQALLVLHTDGSPPEQSPNSAVRTLAIGAATLKQQLIAVTAQEATLQQQISTTGMQAVSRHDTTSGDNPSLTQEVETAERLQHLLENHYTELEEPARALPTPEEVALRELARRDAEALSRIPFSVDKVRLSGAEGSAALAQISQRLVDPRIPESRRDMAPICSIKTRLLDTLVGVENRSLKPVGKNHYIVRVRLQPGETTISVLSDHWEIHLPQHANAQDFLITLYRPVSGTPELHVFAVDELLAADNLHIPAWLPEELDIKTKAG